MVMGETKGESIKYAIQKELSVYSFSDFCKDWGFTLEEVKKFLELGARAFDEESNRIIVDGLIDFELCALDDSFVDTGLVENWKN